MNTEPTPLQPVCWTRHTTPLGALLLAADDQALIGAWFEGQRHFDGVAPDWRHDPDAPWLREAVVQLDAWFAGQRREFDLPLAPRGTPFQRAVWAGLRGIGFGAHRGYGELAAGLGRPGAARAVGAATGRNPISVIVPCHRLLGRDGALTGYAGGLERKRALLAFERQGAAWPQGSRR
jgi:methylated-DNA-[protein]-cysteine S-methyltransferase